MKAKYLIAGMLVLCAGAVANAEIVDWNCDADGDGAIVMNSIGFDDPTDTLTCNGTQHWKPAHILGDFTTDTELDPIVWARNTIFNDSEVAPFSWTDYHINITMNKTFSILSTATMEGWTCNNITQPTQSGSLWTGTVDFLKSGTGLPVNIGDWGQFDVKFSFLGSINFTMEMIPTPEPTTLSLLLLSGLALLRRR